MKCISCEIETIECPMEGMKCVDCTMKAVTEWRLARSVKLKSNKKDKRGA